MNTSRMTGIIVVLALLTANAWGADVILNEYNAVDSTDFLGGGNASADERGGRASDSHFGRVMGNGGDWFELVVIKDHLDMRGWQLDIYDNKILDETLTLTSNAIWRDLRAGTIITVSEDIPSDVSYNPAAGDWWINVRAHLTGDGLYIEKSSFPVGATNWQLRIRNAGGTIIFGPAGEGISPATGIGGTEVLRLEDDPGAAITPKSTDYDDGDDFSTFGAPNRWGSQDFSDLRPVITPVKASIKVVAPNGGQAFAMGDIETIRWQSSGITGPVRVEFSINNGYSWTEVYPPNAGNTGTYKWLVPMVSAPKALVRVSSVARPAVADVSDKTFTIVSSPVAAEMMNFFDITLLATAWMN